MKLEMVLRNARTFWAWACDDPSPGWIVTTTPSSFSRRQMISVAKRVQRDTERGNEIPVKLSSKLDLPADCSPAATIW